MPEDIAIISSKFDVDPYGHGRETDRQKSADGQTDGFSALYSRSHGRMFSHPKILFLVSLLIL